ncbi:hypothetical protein I0C86_33105 [Plantactinospora sp. S1510]|uniref:Uncharacterized protein n=1 Tax=Plantactinospora alkalitolerans TaxID=2789879 RepID=A0ABS0H5J8_9ACTN|nr:hypothetical protein [Plantactinospora alkalitolerans]MBF9133738.1 hypothetical protein [Plantactinospora alkalitolerans]
MPHLGCRLPALARPFASPYWRRQATTDNLNAEPINYTILTAIFEEIRTGQRHLQDIPEHLHEAVAGLLRPGPAPALLVLAHPAVVVPTLNSPSVRTALDLAGPDTVAGAGTADRTVTIVDAADEPMPVRTCWLSWLAVATSDQDAVTRLLGLTDVRPSTWPDGVDMVDKIAHSGAGRFSTVVVTPALNGWILVFGAWLGLPYLARTDQVTRMCEELSARFGKAQAYFHCEQNDGEAWLIAGHGTVLRRWVSEFPELAIGEPYGLERDLLDAFGIPGKPEDLDPDDDLAAEWVATGGDCWATTIAAEHSLDPTIIGPSTPSVGTVLIASTP